GEPVRHQGGQVSSAAPHGGDVDHLASAEWLGRGARWLALLGALLGIGVLAFAAGSLTGSIPEVRAAAFWVRRAGLAVAFGSVVEICAAGSLLHGDWGMGLAPSGIWSALDGSFGLAALFRMAGGIAMLFGAQLAVSPLLNAGTHQIPDRMPAGIHGSLAVDTRVRAATHRLNVGQSKIALAGAGLVALSYLFDGHTVTAEPSWLVRTANVAHVVGAGVWVGGVSMMTWVLRRRHRQKVELRAAELAVRFSTVAAAALIVVALAGSALSFAILDSPGELLSTEFGRLLLLKIAAVVAAAAVGGYNHLFVIPELVRSPADGYASERLRETVRIEAWILVGVVGLTAVLVGAAT
ncbi:MAG: CopD family protein, partial [Actinomycetota bacterium]